MMKHYAAKLCTLSVALLFNSFLLLAQVPAYYNGTDISQTGNNLKNELAALITQTHTTNLSYTPGVWEALKQTDLDPGNPENVLLIYGYNDNDGNLQTDRTRDKDSNGGSTGDWNREHVFAKSLGNPNLGTSGPGADAHHLRASDVSMNSSRGNLPFEDASGNARRINNSWYPGDEWKGDVARMIMYMYLRYGDRCLPSAVGVGAQTYSSDMMDVFLEWNAEDPVSQYERNRNNILENIQGNRNPFIDNPVFATSIWGGPQAEDRFGDSTPAPVAEVLINEIDADTPGSDAMEFIELYDGGAGNTSLNGMVLVLYNGSIDESYRTIDLSGYSTDADGYFVLGNEGVANVSLTFPGNTLQNGADAVALYSGSVADFPNGSSVTTENLLDAIAYDTNDSDDAEILTLLNAGEPQVNEGELGDKDNHSLQRMPNGGGGARNTSTYSPAVPTPGIANTNGGDDKTGVLINEIDADTPGSDALEFIELYDGGTGNTSLDGLVLVLYNGSIDESYRTIDLSGYSTDADGYFVLGNEGVANVSLIFPGNTLQNGADAVALYSGSAADFPNGSAITTENLLDAIAYDTNDSDDAEILTLLNAGESQVNEGELGDKDNHSLQRMPNGEGGTRNTSSYTPAIPTPGTANGNGGPGAENVLINEIDADTPGSDALEFVELYDGGTGNTSLDGLVLVLYNGSIDESYATFDLSGYTTDANGYFVLGNEAVANVSLIFPGNTLQNGADAVALYSGSAADFPNGSAITTENLLDAIAYDTNDDDDAEILTLLNAGEPQVNEGGEGDKDNHSLQRMPNGEGGARNTSSYSPAIPTPGASNGGTTEPTEPVTIAEARSLPNGTTVTISGILTVTDQFAGSAYIQDSTGAIAVFDQSVHGDGVFTVGDSITLTGTRSSYNNQLQISPVSSVTDNGTPNVPVMPVEITLAEMGEHPAELVSISDATFPRPGDMLFGNSNYVLSGDGGTGELRIDNDAEDIVGLAQPDTCTTITGVVGKYQEIYQLLPRMKTDLPCAEAYIPEGDDLNIPRDQTLDVATWNIEWFGDESNSPAAGDPDSDMIQKDSVKTIIAAMDADVIAVEEISDDALFAQMVSEMDGYDYVLSDHTSYPNSPGVKQKVGFIYKTSTVVPVATKPLLASIHPYYNGGDDSALTDYPNDPTRFFASGRLPFLMTADVTIDGSTEQISFIALHARANSSNDPQSRYDMRKYDVEVLKDSLDAMYADANLFVLGDYNDDVDETVADNVNTTITSYEAYMNDGINYNVVSSSLSDEDFRSYVFRENMIDHIMVSNELNDNFIEGSARVGYEHYDSDYTYTASDHFPVSARFRMQALELAGTETTYVSCNGAEDGSASVMVSGGLPPYTYAWSNGEETAGISGLPAGTYSVTVTDASGTKVMAEVEITEPEAMVITIDGNKKVYPGYDPEASAILSAEVTGGKPGYTYTWSTGDTGPDITVRPEETTVYTLTVTDDNGCSADKEITVEAENILCGNDGFFNKIQICYKGKTLCLPEIAAKQLLRIGATLGACDNNADGPVISGVFIFPNPVIRDANIVFRSSTETAVTVELYDRSGNLVYTDQKAAGEGRNRIAIDLSGYRRGMYICKLIPGDGGCTVTKKILKL
ncbi:endonuclease [Sinomicrobium kalidii]|uniref:endonuclease n=1 Tax=Sinomicrobium kalidii TaxID=2900738 RepID=UPI001E474740|nr:endonuclease [Sinomicrobium kalidii]UGU14946.1 endonuclease [Sinomicrobium kalidii]